MSQLVFEAFATDGKAVEAKGKARECNHSGEAPLAQASHHDLSQGRGWNFPGVDVWSEERGPVATAWKKSALMRQEEVGENEKEQFKK